MLAIQTFVDGLILGGIYSLSAVGFSLIFGVLGIVNLAHGIFVVMGAYFAVAMRQRLGLDPLLAIPLAFAFFFVLGLVLQRYLIALAVRKGSLMTSLLITFGLSLMLRDLLMLGFGPDIRTLKSDLVLSTSNIGGVVIDGARTTGLIASLVLLVLLTLMLYRTRTGRAIRATAQQGFASGLCGVDVTRIYAVTFGVSAGFAGISGIIVGMVIPFTPFEDAFWTLNAFVTVVLGGIGSPLGALIGGLILGLINTFSSQYIGSVYPNIFMFLTLLVMLIVRPNGLLGNAFKGAV
jgi:branched-chain amino acid transport system permease protein